MPSAEGRGRDVADQLGAGVAAPAHRPVRAPQVLADFRRDQPEVELEDEVAERHAMHASRSTPARRAKRAPFVEDVVGGELLLRRHRHDLASSQRGGAVVAQPLVQDRDSDDENGIQRRRGGSDPLQFGPLPIHETLPLDQVFDRIAPNGLFREQPNRDVVHRHIGGHGNNLVRVGAKRADGGIDTAETNAHEPHAGVPFASSIPLTRRIARRKSLTR